MKRRIALIALAVVLGAALGCHQFNKRVQRITATLVNDYVDELSTGESVFKAFGMECTIPNEELFEFSVNKQEIRRINLFTATDKIEKFVKTSVKPESEGVLQSHFRQTFLFAVKTLNQDLTVSSENVPYLCDVNRIPLQGAGVYHVEQWLKEPKNNNSKVDRQLKKLESYKSWEVKKECPLTFKTIKKFVSISKKGSVILDTSSLAKTYASMLSERYNTVGQQRIVHLKNKDIEVSGGTYGFVVDEEKTAEAFLQQHKDKGSLGQFAPIYSQRPITGLQAPDDVGNTFIYVNKKKQHVYVYKDGKVVKESDCVTGTLGIHDTPSGVFTVTEIRPQGKYLVGDGYRTWVDHWYRLTNSGVGLHDADWRGSFGGNIYKTAGSHGCINLPEKFADWLESFIIYGTPVVIK